MNRNRECTSLIMQLKFSQFKQGRLSVALIKYLHS